MSNNSLYQRSVVSISDISQEGLEDILHLAMSLKEQQGTTLSLAGKIVAHAFYEPSTRTRLSFEAATLREGGNVIGFSDPSTSSVQKGETLEDTVRMLSGYADAIVLRHPEAGAALRASRVASVPVINAGDGTNEHPTQTLVDLFTIWETQGVLSNLSIGLVGDLRFSRTIHSLVKALVQQGVQTFYCICSPVLQLPEALRSLIEQSGSKWIQIDQISEAIPHLHVLYMTRLQIERLPEDFSPVNYQSSLLTMEDLKHAPPYLKILHPLPRVNEIPTDIDETPYAYYFEQAENGLYVRQALLHCILGEDRSDDGLNDDDMDDDLLDAEDEKRHDGLDG